ncbi:MAG: selenocysteine-specific translation elongation factor [Candidatus Helarchaeota archaeon]|nr:selenocysteine-specific translation elongation factor [Candidatus Helarchaeota archaeon]
MKIPVHIGLFGHIDHGKTAIAAKLSEKISTAGLDKHPQAQERGITIDIGFTAFELNEYLAVLVDAPGHADLISNVVAAANIIDVAILVIAADEGPKIQTGEHILILEHFGVNVVIALNKIDLVEQQKLGEITKQIREVLKKTRFENAAIIPTSAKTGKGMQELKEAVYSILTPPNRKIEGTFKMPIDHAFPIKGAGTVLTGTIHRGKIAVGDSIEITPIGLFGKIKSIQSFKENLSTASAGDRVGMAIPGIDSKKIYRGCYATHPETLTKTNRINIKAQINQLFKGLLTQKMQIHVTVGMPTVPGIIYPYEPYGSKYILLNEVHPGQKFFAYIVLNEQVAVESGDPIVISRLDLPPTTLRIVGSGVIIEPAPKHIEFYREQKKVGIVRIPIHKRGSIVEGLVQTREGAQKMMGAGVITETGIEGKILSSFGTKSNLIIKFSKTPKEREKVFLKRLRKVKL